MPEASWEGTTYRYDGRYYDIVTSSRIVYSYAMYADDTLISVSLATIEFAESGDGTKLTWTEQGAYLYGHNGADASAMRKGGTVEMIEGLTAYLQRQGDSDPAGAHPRGDPVSRRSMDCPAGPELACATRRTAVSPA